MAAENAKIKTVCDARKGIRASRAASLGALPILIQIPALPISIDSIGAITYCTYDLPNRNMISAANSVRLFQRVQLSRHDEI